jgi:hypothetical protein
MTCWHFPCWFFGVARITLNVCAQFVTFFWNVGARCIAGIKPALGISVSQKVLSWASIGVS